MSEQTASEEQPKRNRRLWLGFMVGFGIIFLLMTVFWPMHFFDGQAVREIYLWQYYFLEIRSAFTSPRTLGPTSGNLSAALAVFATHMAVASVGGALGAGIGWATRKVARDP